MDKKNNDKQFEGFFSKRMKAGIRTYFFDVKGGKDGQYFLSISESKKRRDGEGYESHKIFLYPEDFKKFAESLQEALDYVKSDLMPGFDFDAGRPEQPRSAQQTPRANREFPEMLPTTEKKPLIDHAKSEVNPSTPPPINDDEQIDWK